MPLKEIILQNYKNDRTKTQEIINYIYVIKIMIASHKVVINN